jgi:hypothetical protein
LLIKIGFDFARGIWSFSEGHPASGGLSGPSFEILGTQIVDLAKASLLERSCSDEILGLGRKEPSFNQTRRSHRRRCDCVRANRAAGGMPEA